MTTIDHNSLINSFIQWIFINKFLCTILDAEYIAVNKIDQLFALMQFTC